jgi:hypothetical protein
LLESLVGPSAAVMPVGRDAFEYNMKHGERGKAIIFNNKVTKLVLSNTISCHDSVNFLITGISNKQNVSEFQLAILVNENGN